MEVLNQMERAGTVLEMGGYWSLLPSADKNWEPNVIITAEIEGKIRRKHNVRPQEVHQALADPKRRSRPVMSEGENPVALVVGSTDAGRKLTMIVILLPDSLYLVSARTARAREIAEVHYE
ncbi:BrnT family toxin [Meiothermus ruber]|uniref:BrnT family toxin n=2 Tax=Meiothermus ruber (strain ATCC 35948 / DSM 1279 / VKM B-1258 / 21) TaxID=504728 RepID=M9X9Y4_MEIRD|nr:BrnT family toxin [Meiothermus ruber]AGK03423.1 hypothetical protein K649_00555 [Meiothermus ruber DSM 1279]MCL6530807.1 BrnT family toxin [Meiothermus ruber]